MSFELRVRRNAKSDAIQGLAYIFVKILARILITLGSIVGYGIYVGFRKLISKYIYIL